MTNPPGADPGPGQPSRQSQPDCSEALHELYTFLDGELTIERRTHISRHLDDCHGCLEAFDFEAELRIVVSQKCRDEVPETLRQRVAEALGGLDPTLGE